MGGAGGIVIVCGEIAMYVVDDVDIMGMVVMLCECEDYGGWEGCA